MPLIPCKFYAQGNCRFGDQCKFYHEPRGQQQQQQGLFGNRTLAPATFQAGGGFNQQAALNLTAKSNQNLDIIVEGVKKDMNEWQLCKIWPYSCCGPVGGKPCVPGFDDVSPEEFRLAFMQQGNVLPPEMAQRFQQIQQLRVNYQQPTMENRTIIERIATATTTTGNIIQSPFGGQTAAAQPQPASIFGGTSNQQTSSIFCGSGGFQAQPQQVVPTSTSIFGGSSFGSNPAPAFGQPSTLGVFQSPPSQSSGIFGQQSQGFLGQGQFGVTSPQQSSSLFQTPQQPQQTSIFQSPVTTAGTGSFFQQPSTQQQGSIFQLQPNVSSQSQAGLFQQPQLQPTLQLQPQSQPPSGLFQLPQTQQPVQPAASIFNPQQTSLFAPPTGSIFGSPSQQQPIAVAPTTPSIFGGSAGAPSFSVMGNIQQPAQVAPTTTQMFV